MAAPVHQAAARTRPCHMPCLQGLSIPTHRRPRDVGRVRARNLELDLSAHIKHDFFLLVLQLL